MRSLTLARSQAELGKSMSRRLFLVCTPLALVGCVQTVRQPAPQVVSLPRLNPAYVSMYSGIPDELFPIPAINISEVDPRYFRQQVVYATSEPVGTMVVDTSNRFLYLAQEDDHAMRYGIGVGKEGLAFTGAADIARKAKWPRWTPTQNMLKREPERYGPYADGLAGGLTNPLGARALYLYKNGLDTLYRIHGTNEPWSIGRSVSSGCIRMFNQDIIDLHGRTPVGTRVVVLDHGTASV